VLEAGIMLEEVPTFLEHHRQLEAIGFDEATAIAVADALTRAGAVGDRRDAVLEAMIASAAQQVDVQALEAQRQALEGELAELSIRAREDTDRLEALQTEVAALEQEVSQLQAVKAQLEQESERQAGGLAVVEALQAFLLGKTAQAEALWTTLEGLLVWRRKGGRVDDSVGALFTDGVKQKMLTFFQQLIRDGLTK
jgi:septal ring factor EnvC (AmiA/AmiB activator)